jgi:conjugal transfer ATP-binding protein TraC
MIKNLGLKIASLFGEGSHGLNPHYKPLREAPSLCGSLFEYLPYDTFDPKSQLFFNKGSTGFSLMGTPVAGATFNDQGKIDKFFNQPGNLPEGCSMQFLLIASPRIEEKLNYWKSHRTNPKFAGLTQRRYDFLNKKAFDKTTPARDFKSMISYSLPGIRNTPVEKEDLENVRDLLQETLLKIGLHTKVMDDKDLIREVGNLVNYDKTTKQDECWYSDVEEIAKLIPDADIDAEVTKDGFYLRDGKFVAHSFVPKTSPKLWALGHMDKLFGDILKGHETIPCPFIMHYGFTICEGQSGQKKSAEVKREMTGKACQNGLSKWQPGVEEEFLEATEVVKEIQKGERVIDACFSVTTFCEPQDLRKVKTTLESIWNECGWSTLSATFLHQSVFLGSMPMMWTTGERTTKSSLRLKKEVIGCGSTFSNRGLTRRTITKEPQNLLPIVAEWTGQIAPGIPLIGRRGQLFFWSPFDGEFIPGPEMYKSGDNKNFCIAGSSGSGKSFFCNDLIKDTICVGGKAFVMDKGKSFKNTCLNLGGKHVDFKGGASFSLNPFTHIPTGDSESEREDRADLLGGLRSIVTAMAFREGQCDEAGFLGEAVTTVWETYGPKGSIDRVYEVLRDQQDSRSKDIARCLLPFTTKGDYGHYFNPPASINLDSDLVVVETEDLPDDLLAVMTMVMITQVWQKMVKSDRNAPFLVLIDEAWELLSGEASGEFINKLVRTARKYRCALGVATQNLDDFHEAGATGPQAAWQNSAWKLIFRQDPSTVTKFKSQPELEEFVNSGYKETMIRSLDKPIDFSEFLIYSKDISCIPARFYADPYSALLYSTSGSEVAHLKSLQSSGKTLVESIETILEQRQGRAA